MSSQPSAPSGDKRVRAGFRSTADPQLSKDADFCQQEEQEEQEVLQSVRAAVAGGGGGAAAVAGGGGAAAVAGGGGGAAAVAGGGGRAAAVAGGGGGAAAVAGAAGGAAVAGGGGAAALASLTALELLQKEEEELRSIVTFSSQLDAALGGGLPVGKITEICGTPGTGKTQLCLQLAVDVQVPPCFAGVGGQVVYIDTEGSFLLQRVDDIAAAAVQHCSLLVEDSEQRVAMETFTVETVLSNMFLVRCHDYMELLAELHLLPDFLSHHPRVRLLVIDSVAFPFRQHFDNLSQRTRLLSGLAQQLIAMATSHEIAVVITNQMTTRLRGGQSQLVPALGENWGHAATIRLLLRWAGQQRLATISKSAGHMDSTVQYQITSEGFRDDDQSQQPQSKRPRTHTDQSVTRDSGC